MSQSAAPWWKSAIFYQIWPASYKDSNADGIGDIPAIITTLDYIRDLGVDAVWLSPMYASPQVDMGYDISDYEDVYPPFGTLADMDTLIKEMHKRGMKLILDLVVNHTSDQHKWFLESRSSTTNDKADWYIWRKGKMVDGVMKEPNNWAGEFGASAWAWGPERQEYYLHLYEAQQPDLNWENPTTRKAIYASAIKFWLDKGIDGFRVDTVNMYSKVQTFPDAPITRPGDPYQPAHMFYINGPRMHEFLIEMRHEALEKYGDVVMVGELPYTGNEEVLRYVSTKAHELSTIFDFGLVGLGGRHSVPAWEAYKWTLPDLKKALAKCQELTNSTDGWNTVFAENHDQGRSITRFTTKNPQYRRKAGKVLAMMLATLTGTLFLYQGQEIGMVNMPDSWGPETFKDVAAISQWNAALELFGPVDHPKDPKMLNKTLTVLREWGRDNARWPVQWNDSANAGFTTGIPWTRVLPSYHQINVLKESRDPDSVLSCWKRMLKLRKNYPGLFVFGEFEMYDFENMDTFTFVKTMSSSADAAATHSIPTRGGEALAALTMLNFTDKDQKIEVPPSLKDRPLDLVMSTAGNTGMECLGPWEGRVYLVGRGDQK